MLLLLRSFFKVNNIIALHNAFFHLYTFFVSKIFVIEIRYLEHKTAMLFDDQDLKSVRTSASILDILLEPG